MTDSADAGSADTVLADFELTRSLTVQWTFVGTLGFFVSMGLFGALYAAVTGSDAAFLVEVGGAAWWNDAAAVLVFLVLTTAVLAPHEYVHGLAIRYFGGTPTYGVGLAHFVLPYAFATSTQEFSRNQFVVVALAPLVLLSVLGTAAMLALDWAWLVVPLAANAGGAVGDVWMTLTVLSYPEHVRVADHTTGVRVLGRPGDRRRSHSPTTAAWDVLVGVGVATVGSLFLLGFVGPFVLLALGVESITVGNPGTVTYVFSYVDSATELSFGVGPGVFVLGGVLGLAYGLARNYRRGAGNDKD